MVRIIVAVLFGLALIGASLRGASAKAASPIRAGGIGATRAQFATVYGKPTSDVFDDVAKAMHSDSAEYTDKKTKADVLVEFLVNADNTLRPTDRAFDIVIDLPVDGNATWSLDQAAALAATFIPKDAKTLSDLAPAATTPPQTNVIWEEQYLSSAALAKAIPDPTWWTTDGTVGDFTISIQADAYGSWNSITIGTDVP